MSEFKDLQKNQRFENTTRRTFAKSLGAVACLATNAAAFSASDSIQIAVITEKEGPHLIAYLEALRDIPEVDSVLLVDGDRVNENNARSILGDKLKASFETFDQLFQHHRPEMSLVSLEARKAPPAVEAALKAGCHVLAEKPACVQVEDFRSLAQLAWQQQKHLMLALANRLNDEMVTARKLIHNGKIGRIYGVEMHLVADQSRLTRPAYRESWYASKKRAGGGHLIWLGIHWLDLAMFLTGSPIVEVSAMMANIGGQPIEVEDSAVLNYRFDNGALGTMVSGYFLDSGYHSSIKIWGSLGWLEVHAHGPESLKWYSQLDKAAGIQSLGTTEQPRGYTPLVRACVRAAAGIEAPPLTTDDSLSVIETVFTAYRSAELGSQLAVKRLAAN